MTYIETLLSTHPTLYLDVRLGMFIIVILGVFLMVGFLITLMNMYVSPITVGCLFVGIALFACGIHGQAWANDQRPFTITPANSWNTVTIQNITSLSDGSTYSMNGHGSFFLGSGHITVNGKTSTQYVFYKVLPDGYQIGTLDATNVFIREDEKEYPYIEWDYTHTTAPLKRWTDNGEVDYKQNGAETSVLTKTIIHVPKGTVIKDYVLDSNV